MLELQTDSIREEDQQNIGAGGLDFFDSIDGGNPANTRTEKTLVREATFRPNRSEYRGTQEPPDSTAMRDQIAKAKLDIKRALRNTSMVLQDLQDNQSNKAHFPLKPNFPI